MRDGAEKRHLYTKTIILSRQARDKQPEQLRRRKNGGVSAGSIPTASRCGKRHSFLSFPYVCSEPVLVKSSFLNINDRQATENASFEPFSMLQTIDSPRQARDERRKRCEKRWVFCRRAVRWTRRRSNTTSGWACRCCCSSYQKMVRNLNRLFWAHDFLLKHDDL